MSDTWNAASGGPGQDPGMWARLMSYINPIGSANAAPAPAAAPGGRFQGPGNQAQSGGWPVNQAGQPQYATGPINQALASGPGNTNTPAILPHLTGDGPNVQGRPILPYANPNTAALANAASIPTNGVNGGNIPIGGGPGNVMQAPTGPQNIPIGGGPGNTMEAPTGAPVAQPVLNRGGGTPVAQPVLNRGGGTRVVIPPTARAQAPGATAAPGQSPFITIDRPNANPGTGGGMLGGALASPRGQGGAPLATALDLSHLFGGGQPAAAPAAAAPLPRMRINPGVIPPTATASVPPQAPGPTDPSIIARQRAAGAGPIDPSIRARQKRLGITPDGS